MPTSRVPFPPPGVGTHTLQPGAKWAPRAKLPFSDAGTVAGRHSVRTAQSLQEASRLCTSASLGQSQLSEHDDTRKEKQDSLRVTEQVGNPQSSQRRSLPYDQLVSSRNSLSRRLSEANKYTSHLERQLEGSMTTVQKAHKGLRKLASELVSLSSLAETAAAALKFGGDQNDAVDKMLKLEHELRQARKAVDDQYAHLSEHVPRCVPVSWYGPACEVRLMGDFDGWTTGYELSADKIEDSVLTKFEAELDLLPGAYEVKFLIDGEWRLARDWPTTESRRGETNNLIVVE
ncbi:unnamed protein product [Ostreobium quekettii]|uniref:AMP-activated protein kinase glycogen-binding domain-containing protein n=1 Tax=Ostreobium quekettii TaxID=121088 RepID=A0A8S1JCN4_9CHLO|nr:unnamed protein product [Ostreobium quekettii]|eukprot:evm.model.scf_168.1 EVM.evm.TU.scf_168.1   scf_168:1454-5790(+)